MFVALIDWHLERAPSVLLDAWHDLTRRGAGWVKRARQSLAAAPVTQRDLVLRFEKAAKLK